MCIIQGEVIHVNKTKILAVVEGKTQLTMYGNTVAFKEHDTNNAMILPVPAPSDQVKFNLPLNDEKAKADVEKLFELCEDPFRPPVSKGKKSRAHQSDCFRRAIRHLGDSAETILDRLLLSHLPNGQDQNVPPICLRPPTASVRVCLHSHAAHSRQWDGPPRWSQSQEVDFISQHAVGIIVFCLIATIGRT